MLLTKINFFFGTLREDSKSVLKPLQEIIEGILKLPINREAVVTTIILGHPKGYEHYGLFVVRSQLPMSNIITVRCSLIACVMSNF